MQKKVLFFGILAGILLLVVFYNPLLQLAFESYLSKCCHDAFGGNLVYDRLVVENGKWIIEKPRIEYDLPPGHEFPAFQANTLILDPDIHWIKREINLNISLVNPVISLERKKADLRSLFSNTYFSSGILKINSHLTIDSGIVQLHDFTQSPPIMIPFYFSMEGENGSRPKGSLTVKLGEGSSPQSNLFSLSLDEEKNGTLALDFHFDDIACAPALDAIQTIYPEVKGWNIQDGILQGRMVLLFPSADSPYAMGEMSLKNFAFAHPDSEISGTIPSVQLLLQKERKEGNDSGLLGRLEIGGEATLTAKKKGEDFVQLDHLKGSVAFEPQEGVQISLLGRCTHHCQTSALRVEGNGHYSRDEQASIDLDFRLTSPDKDEVAAKLLVRKLGAVWNFAEMDFSNIGYNEFDLLQAFLGGYFPHLYDVKMTSGTVDASVVAYLKGHHVTDLKLNRLTGRKLEFLDLPHNLEISIGSVYGGGAVNLAAQNPIFTLNSDLVISNANMRVAKAQNNQWEFNDIQAELSIQKGLFQKSLIQGEIAGLRGEIELDWHRKGDLIKINFSGETQQLAAFLPEPFGKGVKEKFAKDIIQVEAGIGRNETHYSVGGVLKVASNNKEPVQHIPFGFDLLKTSDQVWGRWPISQSAASYWKGVGTDVIRTILPALGIPSALLIGETLKGEVGLGGMVVRNGWFQGKHLPLEKYVAPFVVDANIIKMTGTGDFDGTFDHSRLSVRYDAKCNLETQDFLFAIEEIGVIPKSSSSKLPAIHTFDFEKDTHFGVIPVLQGTYHEKNTGLDFTNVKTEIILEGKKAHLTFVETFCKGICFGGGIDIDCTKYETGYVDLVLHTRTIQGKVSQIRQMFEHFDQSFLFLKLPLEADVSFQDDGGSLHFEFAPDGSTFHATASGKLKNGEMAWEGTNLLLKDLNLDFTYDNKANRLDLKDIQGNLIVGQGEQADDYTFSGEHIRFSNTQKNEADFDIWIGNETHDLIRLVGSSTAHETPDGGEGLQILLTPELSHFGDIHPTAFTLLLRDNYEIDQFAAQAHFRLNTLLHDLQRIHQSGVLRLSKGFSHILEDSHNISGDLSLSLAYSRDEEALTYSIKGKDLICETKNFTNCSLAGKKKGNTWIIDELILDDLSFAADLLHDDDRWKVNFLGLRVGKSFLMGLEGEYQEGSRAFDAKVNLLEVNLAHLQEWPSLNEFIAEHSPKGILKAAGQLRIETPPKEGPWKVEALLTASVRSWELKGLHFQDAEQISCHYVSNRGVSWRHICSSLRLPQATGKEISLGLLNLEKADYDVNKNEFVLEGLRFNIPSENLTIVSEELQKSFPTAFDDTLKEVLAKAKKKGNFEGSLSFQANPKTHSFKMSLKEGCYCFQGQEHDINNFSMEYDPYEFKIVSQYLFQRHLFWFLARSTSPTIEKGELILADHQPEQQPSRPDNPPLVAAWQYSKETGFQIQKAEGSLAGLSVRLRADPEKKPTPETLHLVGEVKVNAPKISSLLPTELSKQLPDWGLGDGYLLKGKWKVEKGNGTDPNSRLYFHGILAGTDFDFKGYQFQALIALVDYFPNNVRIRNLSLEDPAGTVYIEQIDLKKGQNDAWHCAIPSVQIANFRPSLLRESGKPYFSTSKPLLFKGIEITGLTADLSDSQTLEGKGKLSFVNPPKKNLQNTIFAIPAELLTIIGLDLAVLNPVTGMIYFDIRDQRLYLTRFKDIYSEGKLSKFNLSTSGLPSWVDFDGNLHVRVRMKQYNLIFKLAELFTVTIQGTLNKPTYSLHKQQKSDRTGL
jgi:hypothetical protein